MRTPIDMGKENCSGGPNARSFGTTTVSEVGILAQKAPDRRFPGDQHVDVAFLERIEHRCGGLSVLFADVEGDRSREQTAQLYTLFGRRVPLKANLNSP